VQIVNGDSTLDHNVTVERGTTTSLLIPLAQSGWIDLRAPIDVQVFEGGRSLGSSSDGPLALPPGSHQLQLRNEALGFEGSAQVTVVAGEIARVRPAVPDGLLQVNAQPWAHVWVDGQPVGDTPLGNLRVALGRHQLRFQHPELGEQSREVVVTAGTPARVSVAFR
jgi:hypothetical protein